MCVCLYTCANMNEYVHAQICVLSQRRALAGAASQGETDAFGFMGYVVGDRRARSGLAA